MGSGLSIHACVEIDTLTPALRAWCFAEIHFRRDTELFNLIAQEPARGLPERVSSQLAKRFAEGAQTPRNVSWWGTRELASLQARYHAARRGGSSDLAAVLALFRALDPDEADRCRLVTWFP
jgi:hypothetical protein